MNQASDVECEDNWGIVLFRACCTLASNNSASYAEKLIRSYDVLAVPYLILLTNSLRSPPSTHFSSPPPPTPNPPPAAPPPPTPHPSPTSPMTRAGCPPTTDPEAMTMFVGTTVCGRIFTFSLMMAKGWMMTLAPMWTCDDIEMAEIVLFGPKFGQSLIHCITNSSIMPA